MRRSRRTARCRPRRPPRWRAACGVCRARISDGGTDEKPVGTVYMAVADAENTYVQKLVLTGRTRATVRESSAQHAFDMLRRIALGLPQLTAQRFDSEEPAHLREQTTALRDA